MIQSLRLRIAAIAAIGMLSAVSMTGCSDSASPSEDATVTLQSELETSGAVTITREKGAVASAETVDSLRVTRVRVLFSNLKLHAAKDDSNSAKGTVKIGPFVAVFDSAGARLLSTATIPAGTYDRVKFEIHKMPSSLDEQYRNDTLASPFITNARNTVLIDGWVWQNGVRYPFEYESNLTENFQVTFGEESFSAGSANTIVVRFSPVNVFKESGASPLDPRDPDNKSKIEKGLKQAFKALHKH